MPEPPADFKPASILRAETKENLLDFLETEVALATTMLDLARTELGLGDRDGAVQALGNAERARAELLRWLDRAAARGLDPAALALRADELGRKIVEVRASIAGDCGA